MALVSSFFDAEHTSMESVDGWVFVSDEVAAHDETLLKEHNIDVVIQLYKKSRVSHELPSLPDNVRRVVYNLRDDCYFQIHEYLESILDEIMECIYDGRRVLVHCALGVSRTGAVVAYYLMRKHKESAGDAIARLQAIRPCIDPNDGFKSQLDTLYNPSPLDSEESVH